MIALLYNERKKCEIDIVNKNNKTKLLIIEEIKGENRNCREHIKTKTSDKFKENQKFCVTGQKAGIIMKKGGADRREAPVLDGRFWKMEKKENNRTEKASSTLAEQVSGKLLDYIKERKLSPGDRLETEMEIAERLGVSRSTVREAVKILVSRNILEVRQGSGTYVSGQKGILEDPLGLRLIHNRFKLTWDLLEFRMMIEPQIAYMAALHASAEQIAELERLCDQMDQMDAENRERIEPDIRFHVCVAEASGNLVAPNLIPIIREAAELFIHYTGREKTKETVAAHREILEGIRHRDPEWARDMMNMHLMFNRQELRRVALARGESFAGRGGHAGEE